MRETERVFVCIYILIQNQICIYSFKYLYTVSHIYIQQYIARIYILHQMSISGIKYLSEREREREKERERERERERESCIYTQHQTYIYIPERSLRESARARERERERESMDIHMTR